MFPVTTKAGGMSTAMPDVCKTPSPAGPIPIPYPNIAMVAQGNPSTFSKKVKVVNQPVALKGAKTTMTSGDEAGSAGGVVSGKIKGEAEFITQSSKVKAEGKNVVYHTCQLLHNAKNTPPAVQSVPSQMKVLVAP